MYQKAVKFLKNFLSDAQIYKYGFNFSPMYRRTTGKIIQVSEDLHHIEVKIPISIKNKNYVGAIFGGSLFAATDPIYMIQLINILGDDYVVWDKATLIHYKRPAYTDAFATFQFLDDEITHLKKEIEIHKELTIVKKLAITDVNGVVFSTLEKTIYIANKVFYKEKQRKKNTIK